jgi:hypothetical protein
MWLVIIIILDEFLFATAGGFTSRIYALGGSFINFWLKGDFIRFFLTKVVYWFVPNRTSLKIPKE